MSYEIFDAEMADFQVPDGERLVRVLTGNPMDAAYCIVPVEIDEDELEDELRFSLRMRYGSGAAYRGYEDASHMVS